MTLGEFIPIYLRNHVARLKNHLQTRRRIERFVGQLAAIELGDLKRLQVMEWHRAIGETHGPHAANLALQNLRAMYARAADWDVFDGKNPGDHIKKFPKHSRERFVQTHEMPYLISAIEEEMPRAAAYFFMLLWTGCRRDEARCAKWTDLDLDGALWHKPTTKTGVPHTVPLPAQLVTRLRDLPRINEWVFASSENVQNGFRAGQWSVTAVEWSWRRIRRTAGLTDVRIHDLRRTAASWLAISGENLPVIQRVLNHTSLTSTQIYARLSVTPVRRALNEQAERMLASVPFPSRPLPVDAAVNQPNGSQMEWPG